MIVLQTKGSIKTPQIIWNLQDINFEDVTCDLVAGACHLRAELTRVLPISK